MKDAKAIIQIYTILDIIICNFATFKLTSDLPKVKRCLISSIKSTVNDLADKSLSDLRGRRTDNYETLKKIKLRQRQSLELSLPSRHKTWVTAVKLCVYCDCVYKNALTKTCLTLPKNSTF